MEADFDRFYGKDLATLIWIEEWPASALWSRIVNLPEDAALVRKVTHGHTSLHELLAQVRDAVVTQAHGWKWQGRPEMYQRPADRKVERERVVDPTNPAHAAEIKRFFGTPH